MKATLRNCLAKPSILVAAATLPSFYSALAQAQTPPPPPAAAPVAPAPAAPPPAAAAPAPAAAPAEPPPAAPAVVAPPASETPPAPPTVPPSTAPEAAPPPPPPPPGDEEKYKHINMGVWARITGLLQNTQDPKKVDRAQTNGEVELHFSNQMRKWAAWTANFVATYGGGSIDGSGSVGIMDLIAQLEPDPAFNIWAGRMLVASDRANFSGPYFMAPWNYPGAYGAGPKEGPFGRNDGVTVWGQAADGHFKYYLGAYNLYGASKPVVQPLISARINLAFLSPEPGYYSSSTYYGKDILSLGIGTQYQKEQLGPADYRDYSLFNADLLFEKDLAGSGVFDLEGAFYKYSGDAESKKLSWMGLVSYVTPDVGIGKLQPLVMVQQSTPKADGADTGTAIDGQVNLVVDSYATRFALGFEHTSAAFGALEANEVFAGIQLQK